MVTAKVRRPREKPLIGASFLTAYPGFQNKEVFRSILSSLLARGGIYVPELVQLGKKENYRKVFFEPQLMRRLEMEWESEPQPGLSLERYRPLQVTTSMMSKLYFLPFSIVMFHLQREYFESLARVDEFLRLLIAFYNTLHPAFGDVMFQEMVRSYDYLNGRITPGLDLERALPGQFWALFLGPEYVEMFGHERVFTTPAHRVEHLSDGGALLALTPSPLDYFEDKGSFERGLTAVKNHLGESAFFAWPERRGWVPSFRWVEKERKWKDWTRRRSDWEMWIEGNRFVSFNFRRDIRDKNIRLNFSEKSLDSLDQYFAQMRKRFGEDYLFPSSYGSVTQLAAYVSQVIVKHLGGRWSFDEWDEVPMLVLNGQVVSPLEKSYKVLRNGERIAPWYRTLSQGVRRRKSDQNELEDTKSRRII